MRAAMFAGHLQQLRYNMQRVTVLNLATSIRSWSRSAVSARTATFKSITVCFIICPRSILLMFARPSLHCLTAFRAAVAPQHTRGFLFACASKRPPTLRRVLAPQPQWQDPHIAMAVEWPSWHRAYRSTRLQDPLRHRGAKKRNPDITNGCSWEFASWHCTKLAEQTYNLQDLPTHARACMCTCVRVRARVRARVCADTCKHARPRVHGDTRARN